ncbi:hypothetical protein HMSSN036_52570 [Paenibacillus macerans]|nr:hypothetical protein HMSSN036_52570 [Paenibacillus macerans]
MRFEVGAAAVAPQRRQQIAGSPTLPTKTGTPPIEAILAASILERMPPVPTAEPAPPAIAYRSPVISATRAMRVALGSRRGSLV